MNLGNRVLALGTISLMLCPGVTLAQGPQQDNHGNYGQQGGGRPPNSQGNNNQGNYGRPGDNHGQPGNNGQGRPGNNGQSGRPGDNGQGGRNGQGRPGQNGQGRPGYQGNNGRPGYNGGNGPGQNGYQGNNGRPGYNNGPGGNFGGGPGGGRPGQGRYVRHSNWRRGYRLPRNDWDRGQQIDYRQYRLNAPPRGYQWRQVDGNFVLAAVATGIIASVIVASTR